MSIYIVIDIVLTQLSKRKHKKCPWETSWEMTVRWCPLCNVVIMSTYSNVRELFLSKPVAPGLTKWPIYLLLVSDLIHWHCQSSPWILTIIVLHSCCKLWYATSSLINNWFLVHSTINSCDLAPREERSGGFSRGFGSDRYGGMYCNCIHNPM
jgi:hypothetical protein